MDNEFKRQILQRLDKLEGRIALLEQRQLRSWFGLQRFWLHPPIWTFEQYPPRPLNLATLPSSPPLPAHVPRIAIVTPSLNHARFLDATIDSVLSQNYPNLHYHVQDGASTDGTIELLKNRGDHICWRSELDNGQSHAINAGFAGIDCDIMAFLNSDDTLLPGTLAYVANFFLARPDIDIVYGHRVFVDADGMEIGRAVLPAHDSKTLQYADYIPQETMFWRKQSGRRLSRSTRAFTTHWTGISFCVRRKPGSSLPGFHASSPAFAFTTNRRPQRSFMSAAGRCKSCGCDLWASRPRKWKSAVRLRPMSHASFFTTGVTSWAC